MPKGRAVRAAANNAAQQAEESAKRAETALAKTEAAQMKAEATLAKIEPQVTAAIERLLQPGVATILRSMREQFNENCKALVASLRQEIVAATEQAVAQVRGEDGKDVEGGGAAGSAERLPTQADLEREAKGSGGRDGSRGQPGGARRPPRGSSGAAG